MSDEEFGRQAAAVGGALVGRDHFERVVGASRGSGNPAALAWLAENLRLGPATAVVDLGAGLGGPAAWLTDRYRSLVVGVEPEHLAARGAVRLFGLQVVVASAHQVPVRTAAFDVALLLGVLSTVDDRRAVLLEAARVAAGLGLLEYCATGDASAHVGGSVFPTERRLIDDVGAAGWRVRQHESLSLAPPATWADAADEVDVPEEASEAAVIEAIERGDIAPRLLVAHR